MRNKTLFILAVLIVAAIASGISAAQVGIGSTIVCGELSADDCELLTSSETAMAGLTSARVAFDLNVTLTDMPNAPEITTVRVTGNGAFAGNVSAFYRNAETMTGIMTDPTIGTTALLDAIANIDADLTLNIELPQEMNEDAGMPSMIPLELRLVDGVGYLNFEALKAALDMDNLSSLPDGWAGLELGGFFDLIEAQMAMQSDLTEMGVDADALAEISSVEFLNQYAMVERLEDTDAPEGGRAAVYTTTYDFAGIVSDPAFLELLRTTALAQGEALTTGELEDARDTLLAILSGLDYTQTVLVGVDDSYIRSASTSITFDLSVLDEIETEEPNQGMISINAAIYYTSFNEADVLGAPVGAEIFTLQDLFGNMGGMDMVPTTLPTNTATLVPLDPSPTPGEATPEVTDESTPETTAEATPEPTITGTIVAPTVEVTEPISLPTVVVTVQSGG